MLDSKRRILTQPTEYYVYFEESLIIARSLTTVVRPRARILSNASLSASDTIDVKFVE
jgi:hypothetical protein